MLQDVCLSATGMAVPEHVISNDDLVNAFNEAASQAPDAPLSNSEFIAKASGILNRRFIDPKGILDPEQMRPTFLRREDDALSLQAEFSLKAAKNALDNAQLDPKTLDAIIVSCTNIQRPYPGIAIEVQAALGATNAFAFDMQVACSSATFGINNAVQMIRTGQVHRCLVISPEICSTQVNFRDRDSHFIFGDAAAAVLLESADSAKAPAFEVKSTRLQTAFSNNIRCNFGFLNCVTQTQQIEPYFTQEGRKVFKEVTPFVVEHITQHLASHQLQPSDINRFWLHQANANMNNLIVKKLLNGDDNTDKAPLILDSYGNTASAGSVLALHLHSDIPRDQYGVLCSFGAGYSVGSLLLKKL